jgi:uncharacterized zinc-type alcohol dehydrogenase-like protein
MTVKAYAAEAADQPLGPFAIERREAGPNDVVIEIAFCGVCHSDLHTVRGEWGGTMFPCVPGHEIVGSVSAVGSAVTRFAPGDTVGVGCIVDSCRTCAACGEGLEQFCASGMTGTYNSPTPDAPGHTLGGYSERIVVDQAYVLAIRHPKEQLAAVAPLLALSRLALHTLDLSGNGIGDLGADTLCRCAPPCLAFSLFLSP